MTFSFSAFDVRGLSKHLVTHVFELRKTFIENSDFRMLMFKIKSTLQLHDSSPYQSVLHTV